MNLDIGFTEERINTAYAPLAVMLARYRAQHTLAELAELTIPMRKRDFTPVDKLLQVAVSVLAGCETVSEATPKLKSERCLAAVYDWPRFADQSMLSRMLDALTLKQIEQLRQSTTAVWRSISQARQHDWRSYLWLDFDLSGLPCSAQAEASQKGYFSDKKTPPVASLHGQVRFATVKPSGRTCIPATCIPPIASSPQSKRQKLL